MSERRHGTATRRQVLAAMGAGALAATAGCSALPGTGPAGDRTPVSEVLPSPTRGAEDAPVTVAVYEDFACPHCARYNEEIYPQIESEYVDADVVQYEHRDFPIPVADPESYRAANAARAVQDAAGDAAFFEYAHLLFDNQGDLGPDLYEELAGEVDVDGGEVRSAATNRIYEETVSGDRETGVDDGVGGTPTVFVDGSMVETYAWEDVQAAIEDARPDGN